MDTETTEIFASPHEGVDLEGFFKGLLEKQVQVIIRRQEIDLTNELKKINDVLNSIKCDKCNEPCTKAELSIQGQINEKRRCEKHDDNLDSFNKFRDNLVDKLKDLQMFVIWSEVALQTCQQSSAIEDSTVNSSNYFEIAKKGFKEVKDQIIATLKEEGDLRQFSFIFEYAENIEENAMKHRKIISEVYTREYCIHVEKGLLDQLNDPDKDELTVNVSNEMGLKVDEIKELLDNNAKKSEHSKETEQKYGESKIKNKRYEETIKSLEEEALKYQEDNERMEKILADHNISDKPAEDDTEQQKKILELIYQAICQDYKPDLTKEFKLLLNLSLENDTRILSYIKYNRFPPLDTVAVCKITETHKSDVISFLYNSFPKHVNELVFNYSDEILVISPYIDALSVCMPSVSVIAKVWYCSMSSAEFSRIIVAGQGSKNVSVKKCVITDFDNFSFDYKTQPQTDKIDLWNTHGAEGLDWAEGLKAIVKAVANSKLKITLKTLDVREGGVDKQIVQDALKEEGLSVEVVV